MAGRLYTNEPVGDREPIDSMTLEFQESVDREALRLLKDGYDIHINGLMILIYNKTYWE